MKMTIRVVESKTINPRKGLKPRETCLFIRRDENQDGTYKEFSYICSTPEEAAGYADRINHFDLLIVEDLLRGGLDVDQALEKLERSNDP
jgi:hypothetical protein